MRALFFAFLFPGCETETLESNHIPSSQSTVKEGHVSNPSVEKETHALQ